MHEQRHRLKVVPIRAVHALPVRHLGFTRLHHGLRSLELQHCSDGTPGTVARRSCACCKACRACRRRLQMASE